MAKYDVIFVGEKKHGYTALHLAVQNNHDNVVRIISQRIPAVTSVQDNYGQTPLYWAVDKNNDIMVTQLLEVMRIEDILKVTDKELSILHCAVINKHINLITLILTKVPQITAIQDIYGRTPLHYTMIYHSKEMFDLIFPIMAVEDISKVTKDNGRSILHIILINKEETKYIRDIVRQVIDKCPHLISLPDKYGQTPLHCASSNGILGVVVDLLDRLTHDEINMKSSTRKDALHFAKTAEIRDLILLGACEDYTVE